MGILKNIGLHSKAAPISKICLKESNFTQFDDEQNANTFKNFHSNLPADLVEKLATAKNIFRKNSVKKYCSAMNVIFLNSEMLNVKRSIRY